MQRTTRVMFTHYMARNQALDVLWLRARRSRLLCGEFELAMVKNYHLYSDHTIELIERRQDYPSPLFNKERKNS